MCIRELVARRTGVFFFRVFQANDSGAKRTCSARHVQRREAAVVSRSTPASLRFRTPEKREKITPVLQARNWRSPNFSTVVTINDQIPTQKSGDSHEKLTV